MIFYRKFSVVTVPQNFVGEPFCVSEGFWYGENMKTDGVSQFSVDNFLSHLGENFVGELFCV